MTIINAEKRADWPWRILALCWILILARLRFRDVKDDRDTIFVVITNEALMGVCSVTSHHTVPPN